MPGYLLAAAFHKQAFASATQHQLLAFLQVAAFTNRTAVLPFARVGEPAFVGLPRPGFGGLDRYFDVAGLAARWPCLRAITYDAFRREAPRARIVALQLGLPPGRAGSVVAAGCGRRSRPLVALGATFACASAALAASASATLGDATRWRRDAVIVTNWSQKLVGLGDAASPLFGDAFAARGGCQDARAGRDARAFPPLAPRWHARADAFLAASPVLRERAFVCAHVRAARPRRTRRARSRLVRARSGRPRARDLTCAPNAGREARERRDGPREAEPVGLRRRGRRVDVALAEEAAGERDRGVQIARRCLFFLLLARLHPFLAADDLAARREFAAGVVLAPLCFRRSVGPGRRARDGEGAQGAAFVHGAGVILSMAELSSVVLHWS